MPVFIGNAKKVKIKTKSFGNNEKSRIFAFGNDNQTDAAGSAIKTQKIMATKDFRFKVTYLHEYMAMAFVRVEDDLMIYVNENEDFVMMFAKGYCAAKGEDFFVE